MHLVYYLHFFWCLIWPTQSISSVQVIPQTAIDILIGCASLSHNFPKCYTKGPLKCYSCGLHNSKHKKSLVLAMRKFVPSCSHKWLSILLLVLLFIYTSTLPMGPPISLSAKHIITIVKFVV